ncbi:MAG: DUF2510 domain-containing protein [Acidimicrobiia bacterium]|jgi:hypothetical protein
MAQIGSPSAGWYTDPSGQHRARYWDGASWTEQVRDDLAESSPSSAGSAPAAGSGNAVADTVAGVAEAVAAVAATDVPPPAPEPPLIVDYGTDLPTFAMEPGANGHGGMAVTDPFAPASPAPTPDPAPFTEPAEVAAASFVVDPTPTLQTSTAPVSTGPAPGWYPDPATRHQARLWDGTQWTGRVADFGVESVDPLPGVAAAGVAADGSTVDPMVGAWSSELLDTAAGAVGPDGQPVSAGQASLATLPAVDEPEPGHTRAPARTTAKVRIAGGLVLGGAIALLVGSGLTWMEVTGPKVGDAWTATGMNLGDGRITVVLGIVLAVLGAAIVSGRMTRFGGTKVAAMGALVAGAAALAVTAADIADVADRAARLGVPAGAVTNVGNGLWLAFLGALFAVGGGLMAFANRQ